MESNNPKISVIIPIYNVEKYLKQCLDSVINQTLKDIEIICINDGSTDNSGKILDDYTQKDNRIKVIHKKNEGVAVARNTGIDEAIGDYIMFLDSDDFLEIETCRLFYENAKQTNSDIVLSDYYTIYPNEKIETTYVRQVNPDEFSFVDAPEDFFYIMTGVMGKLYRKSILTCKFPEELVKGEDTCLFWLTCLEHNPKISTLKEFLYNYTQRQDGTIGNTTHIKNQEIFKSIEYLISTDHFKKASEKIQLRILDRFALSIWWELKISKLNKVKLPNSYYKAIDRLIKLQKTLDPSLKNSRVYTKLKKEIIYTKYPKVVKAARTIFSMTNIGRYKVITVAGIKLKIKHFNEQHKQEDILLKNLKQGQKNYPKDCYLLFDCLHDATVECIDAYSLFKYMRSINKDAYYVLLKNSPLYSKLEKENDLEHIIPLAQSSKQYPADFVKIIYDVLLHTKAVITSFGENSITIGNFFKSNPHLQYIFIQHGPTFLKESVMSNGYLYPKKFDKFLVSSENESKLFKQYNWPDSKLIRAGLPRWDLLTTKDKPKEKSILIMLTWRKLKPTNFEKSFYKKNLLKLLNNKKLNKLLTDNNIKLYFAPHHALATNQGIGLNIISENVELINSNNISQYIKKCSCLVTDFSSVAFDFMFQDKPVICYILDKGDPILGKYDKMDTNRFDHKQHIFPNIYFDENPVIEKLKYYIENNFELESEVKKQYDKFFYTKENVRAKLVEEIDKACLENKI